MPDAARKSLADVFERSLIERDASATPAQRQQARDKAFRAPLLMLAIAQMARPDDHGEEIPATERLISAGCAIQNMLLMATALGFGSALTTGKALQCGALRELFNLAQHERPLCFFSVGRNGGPASKKPLRQRPLPGRYVSVLTDRSQAATGP